MTCEPTDQYFHKQIEEYQKCWRRHSNDGVSPELDYNELISTIINLSDKIAELEKRLDKQEEYKMTKCKYWDSGWCYAPDDVKTNARNSACLSYETCPYLKSQMTKMTAEMFGANTPIVPDETLEEWLKDVPVKKMTKKELIQKQIEELQTALKLLEIEENRRTPCEKAYRDAYGEFPITDSMSGGDVDYIAWDSFQKGWESSRVYHNKYFVIPNSKEEEVEKHGESNPYKQYLNSVKTFRQEIFDYGFTDSQIEDIMIILNRWLDANSITIHEDYYTVTLKLNKGRIGND